MTMRLMNWASSLLVAGLLAACGGGGSGGSSLYGGGAASSPSSGASSPAPTLAVALSSNTVTAGKPATVTATLKDATGAGIAGQVVAFSTSANLGAFNVPSALTDSTGAAVVSLTPATVSATGADTVVAAATVSGVSVQATAGFQLSATNVTIGSFVSDLGSASLSAYGQTTLTVNLANAGGASVGVSIASACVAKGKATLTPATVTTSTGVAAFTYRDQGCGATDTVDTLQASVSGTTATSSVNLPLTSPTVSSLSFVSSTPSTIFLKGSGFTETSLVIFQVRDTAGNGLPAQNVTLDATTYAGGLTLDGGAVAVTKPSDSSGNVSVRINSGTVPTPVRVKATLTGSGITTVSSNLSIGVGLPAQLNFSLSQGTINIEGFDVDGTPNTYNIIASDRLGNPVPDNTAINFVAEGGQVESAKFTQTVSGLARTSANFISASPRPADGRVTVVAYALGEESFLDTNGNNVYDAGEDFQDLGNLYIDRLFDGYDKATDQFISLSITGASPCFASSSSLLANDAATPSIVGTCDGVWGRAYVRRAVETVFSTSSSRPVWFSPPSELRFSTPTSCTVSLISGYDFMMSPPKPVSKPYLPVGGGTYYGGSAGVLSFLVADANAVRLNPMAAGTTIAVGTTDGLAAKVEGGSPVPNTSEAGSVSISYSFTAPTTNGVITIKITSPGGLTTTLSQSLSSSTPAGSPATCP